VGSQSTLEASGIAARLPLAELHLAFEYKSDVSQEANCLLRVLRHELPWRPHLVDMFADGVIFRLAVFGKLHPDAEFKFSRRTIGPAAEEIAVGDAKVERKPQDLSDFPLGAWGEDARARISVERREAYDFVGRFAYGLQFDGQLVEVLERSG